MRIALFSFADAAILRYTGCNQCRGIALLPPPTTASNLNHLTASAGGLSLRQLRDAQIAVSVVQPNERFLIGM
jgi:hypothetical protein